MSTPWFCVLDLSLAFSAGLWAASSGGAGVRDRPGAPTAQRPEVLDAGAAWRSVFEVERREGAGRLLLLSVSSAPSPVARRVDSWKSRAGHRAADRAPSPPPRRRTDHRAG